MVNFPDLIRVGRAKKGLNQFELAQKLGVVASAVSQWENGSKTPSGEVMVKIIQELDLVEELFPNYKKTNALEKTSLEDERKRLEARVVQAQKELEKLQEQQQLFDKHHEAMEQRLKLLEQQMRENSSMAQRQVATIDPEEDGGMTTNKNKKLKGKHGSN